MNDSGANEARSHFWRDLAHEHQELLDQQGFENVKRLHSFRYFNWNWRWRSLHRSEQFRFLIANTSPRMWHEAVTAPMDLADSSWSGAPMSKADRWLYTVAVRLLWLYAGTRDEAGVLDFEEPPVGKPLPVHLRGRLISQDLANTALELSAIARAQGTSRPQGVVEVGAGYGRTAYAVLKLFPETTYNIIDIEPALSISRWYLSQFFAQDRLRFLRPDEVPSLPDGSMSLALSISSLQEMSPAAIRNYLDMFDRITSGGIVYLKQWTEWFNPSDRITVRFDDYPVPSHWLRLFSERAPVQSRFTQAAWRIPGP
jgi:putative sugar O-methyltransferase